MNSRRLRAIKKSKRPREYIWCLTEEKESEEKNRKQKKEKRKSGELEGWPKQWPNKNGE